MLGLVRTPLAWIDKCPQNADVFFTPDSIRLHVFTLKIIVRIETLPLHQLTSCVEARALDEVAKDVAIFNQWLPTVILS